MPQPASAAMTCSTVETVAPVALISRVQSAVRSTAFQRAGIIPSSSDMSERRNQIP